MPEQKSKKMKSNIFLDFIAIILSFFTSAYRSVGYMFGRKVEKRGILFKALFFLAYTWPKYFWKSPDFKKILLFPRDFIQYLFYTPHEKN